MDNTSRRNSNEDTTTSMYLSFDAESTMSTACYKTLEGISDISNLSGDMNVSTGDIQINRTLEVHMNSQNNSPLDTVKKKPEILDVKLNTPLKALPKNILKEYKALCSTPSKEHLLKTVEVTRGSDVTRCVDLGLAFVGIDDDKPAFFPPPNLGTLDDNKENVLPDIEEVSTLSCSSGEIITSVIEKKMCSLSIVGSIPEAESVNGMEITKNNDKSINADDKFLEKSFDCENIIEKENCNPIEINRENAELIPKPSNRKSSDYLETKIQKKSPAEGLEQEGKIKPQIAVLNRRTRYSVCEPNLQTGKPSRILSSNNNRRSLLPTSKTSKIIANAETEIPLLINKMLKITDKKQNAIVNTESKGKSINQISGTDAPVDKRRSLVSTIKTRTSILTSAASNKRPFSFTQRMSVVVKTTLNSPARKIARRSAFSSASQLTQRKNAIPQTIISTDISKPQAGESSVRKSMVPKSTGVKIKTQQHLNTLTSSKDTSTRNTNFSSQRKSLYPSSKTLEKEKLPYSKPDIWYTCTVCKEKFRIKSLLDAHKRSHESDNSPPAFIKKPPAIKQTLTGGLLGSANQCKYCDKKFALTKPLHIHLLQNCSKIPPSEKRKLQFTDLNHVEKAQLPNVFPNHNMQSSAFSMVSAANEKPRHAVNKNIIVKTSSESLNDKKDSNLKTAFNGNNSTASQSTSGHKVKKISAHAGVYRTPSKAVPCHLCKLTFKSILDYTNHNLASHGNNKTGAVNKTDKYVESNQF